METVFLQPGENDAAMKILGKPQEIVHLDVCIVVMTVRNFAAFAEECVRLIKKQDGATDSVV